MMTFPIRDCIIIRWSRKQQVRHSTIPYFGELSCIESFGPPLGNRKISPTSLWTWSGQCSRRTKHASSNVCRSAVQCVGQRRETAVPNSLHEPFSRPKQAGDLPIRLRGILNYFQRKYHFKYVNQTFKISNYSLKESFRPSQCKTVNKPGNFTKTINEEARPFMSLSFWSSLFTASPSPISWKA